MKFLIRSSKHVLPTAGALIALGLGLGVVGLPGASTPWVLDPSDDFGFIFARVEGPASTFPGMSEQRMSRIFRERLSQFPRSLAPKLARHVLALCRRYRVDPTMVLSLIEVESGFRVRAQSPAGALGLMQVMPETAAGLAPLLGVRYPGCSALLDPFLNTEIGIAYLSRLRDRYRGLFPYFHLAAYNMGPGKVDSLLRRGRFRPAKTGDYFERIRSTMPAWRAGGA